MPDTLDQQTSVSSDKTLIWAISLVSLPEVISTSDSWSMHSMAGRERRSLPAHLGEGI
jgi:hypothetical protein